VKRRRTRRFFQAAGLVVLLGAGGCAPDIGDLGRARPSVWNDAIFPYAGSWSAWARDEQISSFHLTNDEEELRNRAFRYLMPPHEREWFARQVQELARTRLIPVSWQVIDVDSYRRGLLADPFRSESSRYRRLAQDALADAALVAPFRAVAERVQASDRVRLRTAASPGVLPEFPAEASARVAENDGLIAWVRERARYRLASYRSALVNVVVELPAREAIEAERAIAALEAELKQLDGLVRETYRHAPPGPMIVKH
jgi:hypothetical protein